MKTIAKLIALTVLTTAGGWAGTITITLDNPNQTGSPGDTLQFFGTVTNTGTDTDPADAFYLNFDSLGLSLSDPSYTAADNFGDFPAFSLLGGDSTGDIDLFDITLNDPTSDSFGLYPGTYGLFGGQDGGDLSGQDPLAQVDFSVDLEAAAPEPATVPLFVTGLALIGWFGRGRRTSHRM